MVQTHPTSVSEIFDAFGGPTAFARSLGLGSSTASEMKRRGSIPVRYWPELIRVAKERGLEIDETTLVAIHAQAEIANPRPFPGPGGDGSENTESHAKPHEAA